MRQVPKYLIIGNGKMAAHLCHYLRYLSIPFTQWHRAAHTVSELRPLVERSSHVIILINDDTIEEFITTYLASYSPCKIIHFSGSLTTNLAYSAHPLCSFSNREPYSLAQYRRIPFILEEGNPDFIELLPGINNPYYKIKSSDKQYYHAMCVLSNNFTTLIWKKCFREMERNYSIQKEDLMPLLDATVSNIKDYPKIELTGPLARGDGESLSRDLTALEEDRFYSIFKSFIETFQEGE